MANLLIRDPFFAAPFRLMDELMRSTGNGNRVTGFTPLVDVHETENEYLVKVDLPGVKADDVNVEVNENVLSISGSRVAEETGQAQLIVRRHASFVRPLALPEGVGSDSIEAGFKDGVRDLRTPKPAEQKPKKITI